ncbi:MAG: TonB-dependent receptor plug domain-containing protein, partial [Paludibacteraceae bacterium]|nr:TonB-dependent receptor plug domain-containing protein [Paludibacteraceae bacterium]
MNATCETLRNIREQVADANGIPYKPHVCTYEGPCSGSCPLCEAEARYIEAELEKRQKAKQSVNIVGVAKDKLSVATALSQKVAAATITAVMTLSAQSVDVMAQNAETYSRSRGGTAGAVSSLTGTRNPLYVVDGTPLNCEIDSSETNPLSIIDPNDVVNLEVVKDSAALSRYSDCEKSAKGAVEIT